MIENETLEPQSRSRRIVAAVAVLAVVAAAALGVWIFARSAGPTAGSGRATIPDERPPERPPSAQPVPEPATPAPAATAAPRGRPRPKPDSEPAAPPSAPTTGTLTVESDVPGAMVFLDREFKGAAPVVIEGVAPGSHRLNLSAEGYDGYSDEVEIAAGPNSVTVRFKEVKLDETLKVVHKHTVGSCEGRLLADPHGLRYETTHKNDAFVLKFADLEAFEVDYLKKNLRIKQRGGRTYNFSGDSADALFVFHKNVQKARERIAKGDPPAPSRPK